MKTPFHISELASSIFHAARILSDRLSRVPINEEIADYLNIDEEKVIKTKKFSRDSINLDKILKTDTNEGDPVIL